MPAQQIWDTMSSAYLDRSAEGVVEITGRDRLAVIHRLSTNAVQNLKPGEGQATVFTTNIGRIIDLVSVLAVDDTTALVVTSPGRGPQIATYLRRNLFFNDQFKITDRSADISPLHVYGPEAATALAAVSEADLAALPLWGHLAATIDGCPVRIQRIKPLGGQGFRVLTDLAAVEAVASALDKVGSGWLSPAQFALLRIDARLPDLPELTEDFIPLETDLWDAVSFHKGCYVGQEIIARMDSRGRIAKKLTRLHLDAEVTAPTTLRVGDAEAGILTSVAPDPAGGWLGLGYVRAAHLEPGTTLRAENATATVAADADAEATLP